MGAAWRGHARGTRPGDKSPGGIGRGRNGPADAAHARNRRPRARLRSWPANWSSGSRRKLPAPRKFWASSRLTANRPRRRSPSINSESGKFPSAACRTPRRAARNFWRRSRRISASRRAPRPEDGSANWKLGPRKLRTARLKRSSNRPTGTRKKFKPRCKRRSRRASIRPLRACGKKPPKCPACLPANSITTAGATSSTRKARCRKTPATPPSAAASKSRKRATLPPQYSRNAPRSSGANNSMSMLPKRKRRSNRMPRKWKRTPRRSARSSKPTREASPWSFSALCHSMRSNP